MKKVRPQKIAFVGTYPPRQCGIATFTQNLIKSFPSSSAHGGIPKFAKVVALGEDYDYPEEVTLTIREGQLDDYIKAADYINFGDCELCVLEHEFGIFGGESGIFILPFIYQLEVPLIVTLHTVLKQPNFTERSIICAMARRVQKLIVMSELGVQFLKGVYDVPEEKIALIEHGVPDEIDITPTSLKNKFVREGRKMLFTFGLLSRNKGIETVINALPKVIEHHPDVLYIILGNTHQNVLRESGEAYRNYLQMLVRDNGLEAHVLFLKKFVTETELLEYLRACDIYITPYISEAQITSGTLSYAIGAGAPTISTPYWHARELLANNRGRLFDFKDSDELAHQIIHLLDHPDQLALMHSESFIYGKKFRWKKIGKRYEELCHRTIESFDIDSFKAEPPVIDLNILPPFNLAHLKRLTDDTGIVQHAKYGVPNMKEGYCLDDNARALLAALMIYKKTRDKDAYELLPTYFSYINYMQNIKGTFRNFLSFDRQFLDEEGSEDAFGRSIWALGYLIRHAPNDAYSRLAYEIFDKSKPNFERLGSLRGVANTLIGVSYFLQRDHNNEEMISILHQLVGRLVDAYHHHRTDGWEWFEDSLTYDNGILPFALLQSVRVTDDRKVLKVAEEAIAFLDKKTMVNGVLSPIGSNGWYLKNGDRAHFAQQATDAMAMVLMYYKAFVVTKRKKYLERVFQSFMWFLGENELKIPLYDHETKGCCDGLESYGVNRNQGAESTLAYLISHVTMLKAASKEFLTDNHYVKGANMLDLPKDSALMTQLTI